MCDVAKEAWRKYLIQLQVNPLWTKALTSGVVAALGEALAQRISGVKKIELRKVLLFSVFGFAYGGPFGHYLHKLMSIIFKGKNDTRTVAKMVLFEQLTSSPCNNLLFMLYYGLVIEGRTWALVKNKIKKDFTPVQLAAWKVGPMVAWVNNQFVPLELRVIFQCFVGLCWTIFLNLKARSAVIKDP
ncbi:PEROXISOMAL MEMBRANE PROTEIN 2 PXMP2 MPV17 [Salix purpurea]|uniref:PEROXISOMAL MEMBRANE PROTEIN 2 PXMP2 MPV17 n=1 Tax=Salix purpurea TaxID=77065 RepID=A0A9Q0Z979_SALPP|nr:PEROXISOMAL MEMBRANE PROTEIN 2 PXMP2 MPV17 [Salix purpurea]